MGILKFENKTLHRYITDNVLHTLVFRNHRHISGTSIVNLILVVFTVEELECLAMDEVLRVCNNIL